MVLLRSNIGTEIRMEWKKEPDRGNNTYKGPGVGINCPCWGNRKGSSASRGKVIVTEGRGLGRAGSCKASYAIMRPLILSWMRWEPFGGWVQESGMIWLQKKILADGWRIVCRGAGVKEGRPVTGWLQGSQLCLLLLAVYIHKMGENPIHLFRLCSLWGWKEVRLQTHEWAGNTQVRSMLWCFFWQNSWVCICLVWETQPTASSGKEFCSPSSGQNISPIAALAP